MNYDQLNAGDEGGMEGLEGNRSLESIGSTSNGISWRDTAS
jgi:hypothetical protein